MKQRNSLEQSRVSGLLGLLTPTESTVSLAYLSGRVPADALAEMRGKPKATAIEARDVRECMASERVRRTIAGAVQGKGISQAEMRQYVIERLVTESQDAKEGSTRLQAVKHIGDLPGVDMWRAQDDRDQGLEEAGASLLQALETVALRLSGDVIDVGSVQHEPDGHAADTAPAAMDGVGDDDMPDDPFA